MKTRFNPLRAVRALPAVINLILKRQRHNLSLTLLALLNIVLAVGLVTNASFFSQAVDRVILAQELDDFSRVTGRPPFSTSAYVFPSRRAPITLEDAEQASDHVAGTLGGEVGLPVRHLGLEVSSGGMMLRPSAGSDLYTEDADYLGNVELVYVANVAAQMDIVAGTLLDEDGASGGALDVWMHERLAQEMGARVGESFDVGVNLSDDPLSIRLAGLWHARDPVSDFWFNDPDTRLDDALLVRRQDYVRFVQPRITAGARKINWYIILDDNKIVSTASASYLDGFTRGLALVEKYVPGIQLNAPPLDPLENFAHRSTTLTVLLLGFNLPAFGILLYFLALTSAIIAQWQRKETSVLVSRGMSGSGVLNLALIEQLLLSIVAYPLGTGLGMSIARVMGYTDSFLSFTRREPLPVSTQGLSLPLTLLALAVALLARLWPAVQAARQSVLSEERERARPSRSPFWYRYYLDLLLLLPTGYAYRQLARRGSLAALVSDGPRDLYQDPLLILLPALFVLTASMLTMRLFPFAMRLADALTGLTPWLTIHLTLRQLSRRSQDYVKPLLLVIISLAMGIYTLSMAASLDQWLIDRTYYRVGADLAFTPRPLRQTESPLEESVERIDGNWIPLPSEWREIDGIARATEVGDFGVNFDLETSGQAQARFLGIDRIDFPLTAWFRTDFANESLGALMNRLALTPESVLVSRDFLAERYLRVGDQIPIYISINPPVGVRSQFTIAGIYDYFPTVYEEEESAIIGNLDYVSFLLGATVPHDVWLKLDPGVDGRAILQAIPGTAGIDVSAARDARTDIHTEQAKMERVGVFGILSTGFIAAMAMAVLGLLIYSYASLQERVYRFAVLHAIGLSRGQIVAQVMMEYAFLAAFGALSGALIGVLTSELFVPFFRYTGELGTPLPPLLPIIARHEVLSLALGFGLLIVLAQAATIASVLYRRVLGMLKRPWI